MILIGFVFLWHVWLDYRSWNRSVDVCHGLCAVVLEIARGHQRQLVLQAHRTNMVKSVKYGMEMFILFGDVRGTNLFDLKIWYMETVNATHVALPGVSDASDSFLHISIFPRPWGPLSHQKARHHQQSPIHTFSPKTLSIAFIRRITSFAEAEGKEAAGLRVPSALVAPPCYQHW